MRAADRRPTAFAADFAHRRRIGRKEYIGGLLGIVGDQAMRVDADGKFRRIVSRAGRRLAIERGERRETLRLAERREDRFGDLSDPGLRPALLQQAAALSDAKVVVTARALISAQIGDLDHAGPLAAGLDKQYPQGSFVQKFWLPLLRGEIALHQGNGTRAVEALSAAEPLDPSVFGGFSVSPLYPAYVRGQAYLLAGDGDRERGA